MLAAQLAEHELQRLLEEERLEAVSDMYESLVFGPAWSTVSPLSC